MVNTLNSLRNRLSRNEEGGGMMVLYLLLFPLVFTIFGLAVDTTLATYTQTSIQSNLDAATQSALSRANNPGTHGNKTDKPFLSPEETKSNIIRTYDFNRYDSSEQPFLRCQTTAMPSHIKQGEAWSAGAGATSAGYVNLSDYKAKLINPPSGCAWTQTEYLFRNHNNQVSVKMTVGETSNTLFLSYLGFSEFKYYITSEARITYQQG